MMGKVSIMVSSVSSAASSQKAKTTSHAIVIGGSIAGLASAQALSRYFETVTILERDRFSEETEFRKGIPQNRQPHALLKRGLLGLEDLFPNFTQKWVDAGAVPIDFGHEVEWWAYGGWRPQYSPGLLSYGSSRPLLEGVIRKEVMANPRVRIVEAEEVIGLVPSTDGSQVNGVRVRSRDRRSEEEIIPADLVVDASGRESHTQDWLEELGYPCPDRTVVNAFPGYSSRIYERPATMTSNAVYIQPTPPVQTRGAIILPLEGNRIHIALVGMSKDYPPTDEQGFLEFLQNLPDKRIYEIIKSAKPLSPIIGYRRAENVWYHYEKLSVWPDNFVALGDSVLAFNPVYGQGMTVAVMSALHLDKVLKAHLAKQPNLKGFAQTFQKGLGEVQAFAWQLATGEDRRWGQTAEEGAGKLSTSDKMRLGFLQKVMVASTKDPVITEALYRVMNMVASPATFFRPDMLVRVLRAS